LRLAIDGPAPRDADAAREAIIDQVRPIAADCYRKAGGEPSGQRGRLRVVIRFDKDFKADQVDTTSTGSLSRAVAECTRKRIAKTPFRVSKDTPRFLSFPVVLPIR